MRERNQNLWSRRSAIGLGRKTFLATPFIITGVINAGNLKQSEATDKQPPYLESNSKSSPSKTVDKKSSASEINTENDRLNDLSAAAVVATFATTIGLVAAGKTEFSAKTIGTVGSAEMIRLATLAVSNREVFEHELNEHAVSLPLALGLATMAETAYNTRAYVDTLFEEERFDEEIAEALALEETHLGKHNIDVLKDKSISECQEYLEQHKDEVLRLVAGNTALTSVLAPVATTYTATSAAADSFAPITRALIKAYYAAETIKRKKAGDSSYDDQNLTEMSLQKATKMMNGPDGFCNLSLALTANTSGMSLIGDPPLVYSFVINRSIPSHLLVSGEGFVFSEIANVAATTYWLKKTGLSLDTEAYLGKFAEYSIRSLSQLASSPFGQKTREAAYAGYKRYSEDLTQKLDALGQSEGITPQNIERLREYMKSMEHPIVQIDIPRFISQKVDAFQRFLNRRSSDSVESEIEGEKLLSSLRSEDQAGKEQNLADLSDAFLRLLSTSNSNSSITEILSKVAPKINEFGPQKIAHQLEDALADGILSPQDSSRLRMVTGILGPQDVKDALNDSLERYRGVSDQRPRKDVFFGHTSKEVLNALWTQLPAVPALIHSAEKILPKMLGLKNLEEITPEQVDTATFLVLSATAAISSTADNVAAYIFGKKLLEDIYSKADAQEFQVNEGLKQYANNAPLISAIIGGSLSKIGNGPNFLISKIEAKIENGSEITVKKKPVSLGASYLNPYSWTQTISALGALMAQKKLGAFISA